jgi:mannose-6-phosphate isomerase-like protein (cupin superfamily)
VAHAGQVIEGQGGFRLRLVEIEPERLVMEAAYGGDAPLPPPHLHPLQEERFEVLEGRVHAVIGGEERHFEAGASFDVPAGTLHQMTAAGPSLMAWEVTPALRTADFFERLYAILGDPERRGELPALLDEFSDEIRFPG